MTLTQSTRHGDMPLAVQKAVVSRVSQVVDTLTGAEPPSGVVGLLAALDDLLAASEPDRLWLASAVIGGALPTVHDVRRLVRVSSREGPRRALEPAVDELSRTILANTGAAPDVEIVHDAVTVDVHHTSSATFTSGIQRVARECVRRWCRRGDVRLVSWRSDRRMMRPVTDAEFSAVTMGVPYRALSSASMVVPWKTTHLIPELPADPVRCERIEALSRYAGVDLGLIGYDVIPLTMPSCFADDVFFRFTRYLAAISTAARIATISDAAAREFAGWRAMLAGRGRAGPDIHAVRLPVHVRDTSAADLAEARRRLCVGAAPLMLVVGSHEPRKNHLAVLHAAEILWREGFRFNLAFAGSNSWKADAFYRRVADLQRAGRAVQTALDLTDGLLWAAYRLAHCVVFPSLNEGFGLPVAEALAVGTPVITSNFGSMAEIVAPQGVPLGGLLVDSRDDASITQAMRSVLVDRSLYSRLRTEAADREPGSWDDYADATWSYLVDGNR